MSWSLGNKKWKIPFVSLNGTMCSIDIYKRGYTGSEVIELSTNNANAPGVPAANPFYYEEDDDDDLLQVVRIKTGYINLIETVYGGLSELLPSKENSLYIEFYQGSTLNFVGFIQAQSFDNQWIAAPREISLPIISPLGLLDTLTMPVYNPPQYISLAAQLDDVIDLLAAQGIQYTGVTWPQLSTGLDATISSLVTSPFNENWTPANYTNLFSPINARTFIEGLCNAFGWIVHETSTQLVFSMYDHTGSYNYVTTGNLRTLTNVQVVPHTGADNVPVTNYATPCDSNGQESTIVPLKKIILKYDGEFITNSSFNFDHFIFNGTTIDGNQYVAWLTRPTAGSIDRTPEISEGEYSNFILPSNAFYNGKLTGEGVNPCSCGTRTEQKECLLVNLPRQNVVLGWIFTVKFFDRPQSSDIVVKWESRWADTILDLTNDDSVPHKKLGFKVKVGDLYLNNGQWTSTPPSSAYENGTILPNVPNGTPIELNFYEIQQESVDHRAQTLTIEDLRLEELTTVFSNYVYVKPDEDIIVNGNGDGSGDANIDMLITAYRKRSNQIGTEVVSNRFTDYQYLMKSNARLQIRFKKTAVLPSWVYIAYMTFMSQSWRIISISEYPWDDEVIITMHRPT